MGWFDDNQIISDDQVKGNLFEWGVECVDDLKLVPVNMWTQLLKPKLKFIELCRAEFALKKLQEEKFNMSANKPLNLNNPTGTNKPQNIRKSNTLHGGNIPSTKKYSRIVHTTKNNTPQYFYKKKKSTDSNITCDIPDESSTECEGKYGEDIVFQRPIA